MKRLARQVRKEEEAVDHRQQTQTNNNSRLTQIPHSSPKRSGRSVDDPGFGLESVRCSQGEEGDLDRRLNPSPTASCCCVAGGASSITLTRRRRSVPQRTRFHQPLEAFAASPARR